MPVKAPGTHLQTCGRPHRSEKQCTFWHFLKAKPDQPHGQTIEAQSSPCLPTDHPDGPRPIAPSQPRRHKDTKKTPRDKIEIQRKDAKAQRDSPEKQRPARSRPSGTAGDRLPHHSISRGPCPTFRFAREMLGSKPDTAGGTEVPQARRPGSGPAPTDARVRRGWTAHRQPAIRIAGQFRRSLQARAFNLATAPLRLYVHLSESGRSGEARHFAAGNHAFESLCRRLCVFVFWRGCADSVPSVPLWFSCRLGINPGR